MSKKIFDIQDSEIPNTDLEGKYSYGWVENSLDVGGEDITIKGSSSKDRYLGKTIQN